MQDLVGQFFSNPTVTAALTVLGIGVAALWVLAAWWTYQDMGRRSESEVAALGAVAWILLSTPALLPLSLPVYLLARPQRTAAQSREQSLVLALQSSLADTAACPGCGMIGDPEWRRCPTCATWLETDCESCGRWSSVRLDICPWCAAERPPLDEGGVLIGLPDMRRAAGAERAAARRVEGTRRRQVPARLG